MTDSKEPVPVVLGDGKHAMFRLETKVLRKLIEGLRALPNVSEMAIINAIAELDRIATDFEEFERQREALNADVLKRVAALMISALAAGEKPTEGCYCARCVALREAQQREAQSGETSKGKTLQ